MKSTLLASLILAALSFSACGNGTPHSEVIRTEIRTPGGYTSFMYSGRTKAGSPSRTILFLHGGGLVLGSPTMPRFDDFSRWLASHGHTVVSLRYPMLWQGLDRAQGTALLHDGLKLLAADGNDPIAIVAVSAGAWLAERGLEDGRREGWPELAKLDRFAGVSPLLAVDDGFLRTALARIYERGRPAPVDPSALPRLLLIQGDSDWLVPAASAAPLCESKGSSECRRISVPGGHFQLHDGVPGTPESGEALLRFLSE